MLLTGCFRVVVGDDQQCATRCDPTSQPGIELQLRYRSMGVTGHHQIPLACWFPGGQIPLEPLDRWLFGAVSLSSDLKCSFGKINPGDMPAMFGQPSGF